MNTHHSTQTSYSSMVLDFLQFYDGNYKASVAEGVLGSETEK